MTPDVATQGTQDPRASVRVQAATVEVLAGPDVGRTARIDTPTFVIGTGDSADLRLSDPTVSREHVRITLSDAGVHVRDGGSKNGTWIGAMRLGEATLTADVVLGLGTTSLALRVDAAPLDLPVSQSCMFGDALGFSTAMRHVFAQLERVAGTDITVLLEGESGVGKEILARALHQCSPRHDGPFVVLDCGTIPCGLIESELFGHERGAFTGAVETRRGVFVEAHGGTLFLDEVGELPIELQPKLLRVLEQRVVRPIGGKGARPVDVRVIAATNRRLAEAVRRSEFRSDLFYRLAVARVVVPALRDRSDDLVPLARMFLRRALRDESAELPPDFAALLQSYAWPGNVRELRNVIDRYALLGARTAADLFDTGFAERVTRDLLDDLATLSYHEARRRVLERFERAYLPRLLERAGGVVARAAELAEVARPSLYRMLERARLPEREGP